MGASGFGATLGHAMPWLVPAEAEVAVQLQDEAVWAQTYIQETLGHLLEIWAGHAWLFSTWLSTANCCMHDYSPNL